MRGRARRRPLRRHRGPVRVAAGLLPAAVSRRRQDQRLRDGDDDDQGHRHLEGRRDRLQRSSFGNYLLLVQDDLYLRTYVVEPGLRRGDDRALPGRSATRSRTSWRARGRSLQPALLMLVMLPFWTSFLLRVYAWKALLTEHGLVAERDRVARTRPRARRRRSHPRARAADEHAVLARPRHDLHLPAVHDPAALLEPGEDGPAPARGRRRPRRERLDRVLEGHRAALARRHHRRRDARLHSLRRRVRHPRAARRPADADDRPHALGRVLQQQRLADGLRRRRDDGAARDRAARRVQPLPGRGRRSAPPDDDAHAAFNRIVRARLARARLRLPVRADRRAGRLLVQRLAGRQRLARLHAALVRRARLRPRAARRASRSRSRSRSRPPARRSSSARSPRSRWSATGASSAARCSPAWSRRRWSCPR